jgi:hypothetical protein
MFSSPSNRIAREVLAIHPAILVILDDGDVIPLNQINVPITVGLGVWGKVWQ